MEEIEASKTESVVSNSQKEPTGRVIAIKRRNWRPYCGSLQKKSSTYLTLFVPVIVKFFMLLLLFLLTVFFARSIDVFLKYESILSEYLNCLISV